ncbi:unnamed protein product, partial [Brassica rapa subsp. trilocularis]
MLSNRISISSPSQIKPCTSSVFVLLSGTEEKDTSCVVDRFFCCLCNSLYHCPFSFSIVFQETK